MNEFLIFRLNYVWKWYRRKLSFSEEVFFVCYEPYLPNLANNHEQF